MALDEVRRMLKDEVKDLCRNTEEMPLPPLRVINHRIPLIDDKKPLPYRTARCPEALRPLWNAKSNLYERTKRWKKDVIPADKTVPLLVILKKPGPNGEVRICTVLDKRALNENMVKMASPPDKGIKMDPHKVDNIMAWKSWQPRENISVPTGIAEF